MPFPVFPPGRWVYFAGATAGTVNVPPGGIVTMILVRATTAAGGTMVIFGKPAITIPAGDTAPTLFPFMHEQVKADASGAAPDAATQIVFAGNIGMYYVDVILPGNGN